jgi:Fe-S oxidoreductase
MTVREGSLEAPTRHPLDWKSADFYDQDKLDAEMHRVFDICHGCRRCVSLCGSFPTLFDLIDEGKTGELDGVDKKDFTKVVDQCYLCDVCYLTKCPYVPPHAWNLDFPHLMLRAKAVRFKTGGARLRDKVMSETDALGKLASIPVVVKFVNAANNSRVGRAVMEKTLGVDAKAWIPSYSSPTFRNSAGASAAADVREGTRAPGKVAIFSTCYINYNEPGIGHDLARVLDHNEIPWAIVEKEACCGMPKLELGDLEAVAALKEKNIPPLAKLAREGYAIVTPIPSCTLMFKQELPLLFPEDADVQAVRAAMFDPFEYLMLRHKDGLLKTDFKQDLGKVSYHVACHLRVQNMGQKTREVLQLAAREKLNTVERCSGHSGSWGCKKEFHAMSMKIGRPVFRALGENPAGGESDWVASDCQLAGRHIEQGLRENGRSGAQLAHPLTLLRIAYGL